MNWFRKSKHVHDWRYDPEGWKPLDMWETFVDMPGASWVNREQPGPGVRFEYIRKVCAECSSTSSDRRRIAEVDDWPTEAKQ